MISIECEFAFELASGFVVLLRFPIEVAQAEVNIWLLRGDLGGRFELTDCLRRSPQTIESLPKQNVGRSRIRLRLDNFVKLFLSAVKLFGRQAALRKHVLQFAIRGVGFCQRLQKLHREYELL